jgi:thioredoxin-like negative regulator of GroEL
VRLATVLRYDNDLAGAEREIAQILQTDPQNGLAHAEQFEIYAATDRCDSAQVNLRSAPLPVSQYNQALVAYYWSECGQLAAARRYADSVAAEASRSYVDEFSLAIVFAGLEDSTRMYTALNQAVTDHDWALFFLGWHFAFAKYRDAPEFKALMKRANVK